MKLDEFDVERVVAELLDAPLPALTPLDDHPDDLFLVLAYPLLRRIIVGSAQADAAPASTRTAAAAADSKSSRSASPSSKAAAARRRDRVLSLRAPAGRASGRHPNATRGELQAVTERRCQPAARMLACLDLWRRGVCFSLARFRMIMLFAGLLSVAMAFARKCAPTATAADELVFSSLAGALLSHFYRLVLIALR